MKVQSKKGLGIVSKLFLLAAVLVLQAVLLGQTTITVNAQGTAKVTADSGKIRKAPDTSADVLGSVKEDDKLTVIAQTTASDGYTWYKVFVDDSTKGYIRADLVGDVEGSIETESASDASTNNDTSSESTNDNAQEEEDDDEQQQAVEFVKVNPSNVTKAKVTASSVNVRSNPSTSASVAGKAKEGTEVNVFGEASDNSGDIWYQVKYTSNDTAVEGFIRSDFVEVVETQDAVEAPVEEVVEETPAEEVEEEPSVPKEYEVVYEANPEGEEEWFLYDHNRGTKQSIADLLAVVRQMQDNENSAVAKLKTYKLLMIVMVAVILALIVGITLLIFKLRDAYDYGYEEDEDEDDEEEDDEDEDDEDEDDEDEDEDEYYSRTPVRRPAARPARFAKPARAAEPAQPRNTRPAPRAAEAAPKKKESSSWQSKNFMDIDDDMEFEFLDIK